MSAPHTTGETPPSNVGQNNNVTARTGKQLLPLWITLGVLGWFSAMVVVAVAGVAVLGGLLFGLNGSRLSDGLNAQTKLFDLEERLIADVNRFGEPGTVTIEDSGYVYRSPNGSNPFIFGQEVSVTGTSSLDYCISTPLGLGDVAVVGPGC